MYRGYKIVANSAAGHRRYMQWLVPYYAISRFITGI